ncbi:hypothetical protein BE20_05985 [Sorangium cellulosum]|uniref:Rad50/SbcC-type AAA domain-containing protein n=1 Tax=Sorangium cellulosum TaxID=56 RepID=A0A150R898_SORCE|nr:hypothetical protein BE18_06850 [Sorangium cellulosum]KYF94655.1 hypothetical protein BE20_05985 [Sorangium cellulosum]
MNRWRHPLVKTAKKKDEASTVPSDAPINIDDITDRVLGRFAARSRDEIPRDEVRKVVTGLDLAKIQPNRKVPRLLIRRLKFKGTKTLDGINSPIDYEQPFQTGVNVLVIEDNLVGKSSVLKTIKFALTGNDEEYDQEVRRWITDIWLQFSLDDRAYTILLARREDGLHGRLAPGDHDCPIEKVPKAGAAKGFYHRGETEVQQALESFFVREFGLASLGWNQALPTRDGGSIKVWASWLTYFQALRIPDDNHAYLLCKPEYANQDQLLFSAFLGLHLSEPLNQLSMESAAIRKRKEFTEEQASQMAVKKAELLKRRTVLREQVAALDAEQARRLEVITGGNLAAQLVEAQGKFVEGSAEVAEIEEQLRTLTSQMQQCTATARRLREQIDLSRELTGLDVKICPNCVQSITPEAMQREKESYQCRLCVRPVPSAGEDVAAPLEAAARGYDQQAAALKVRIGEVNRELVAARRKAEGLRSMSETLRTTIKEGVSKGLPTPEEVERRGRLHEEIGGITQEIADVERSLGGGGSSEDHDRKAKIIDKVQLVLKEEAELRNQEIEDRLNDLAKEVIKALRADQISGIKCYPTGVVKLTKNGEPIAFSKIMNPGERYRAKLALFLAMMRLGCEAGVGRHPGFLMLDQLGTAEMVPTDLQASATALKRIEDEYSDRVQILCFTTRPEFRQATLADKVYGHRTVGTTGKKFAF